MSISKPRLLDIVDLGVEKLRTHAAMSRIESRIKSGERCSSPLKKIMVEWTKFGKSLVGLRCSRSQNCTSAAPCKGGDSLQLRHRPRPQGFCSLHEYHVFCWHAEGLCWLRGCTFFDYVCLLFLDVNMAMDHDGMFTGGTK